MLHFLQCSHYYNAKRILRLFRPFEEKSTSKSPIFIGQQCMERRRIRRPKKNYSTVVQLAKKEKKKQIEKPLMHALSLFTSLLSHFSTIAIVRRCAHSTCAHTKHTHTKNTKKRAEIGYKLMGVPGNALPHKASCIHFLH